MGNQQRSCRADIIDPARSEVHRSYGSRDIMSLRYDQAPWETMGILVDTQDIYLTGNPQITSTT